MDKFRFPGGFFKVYGGVEEVEVVDDDDDGPEVQRDYDEEEEVNEEEEEYEEDVEVAEDDPGEPLSCMKIVTIVFELLLFASALVLFCVGVYGLSGVIGVVNHFLQSSYGSLRIFSQIYIAFSVIILSVSWVGVIATICEKKIPLLVYMSVLLLVSLGLIASVALEGVYLNVVDKTFFNYTVESITYYDPRNASNFDTIAWDKLQRELLCCGMNHDNSSLNMPYHAWRFNNVNYDEGKVNKATLPRSCCNSTAWLSPNPNADDCRSNSYDVNKRRDCYKVSLPYIREKIVPGVIVGAVVVFFAFACSAVTCLFYLQITPKVQEKRE